MTLGEKLAMYRKQNNYTQEQLAELLGVSRQAISKWESDLAYPETEKLIKLSDMYGCTLDYLIKDKEETKQTEASSGSDRAFSLRLSQLYYEKKSVRTVRGVPLWHINIGLGRSATGIVAVGLAARGVVAFGLLSLGVVSFGLLSLGVFAFASIAMGLFACGGAAIGAVAFGGATVGLLAFGGAAVGLYSVGGAAAGYYAALGGAASGQVAVGDKVTGTLYEHIGKLSDTDITAVRAVIDENSPLWLKWAAGIFKRVLSLMYK